jgi:hypothetical protein
MPWALVILIKVHGRQGKALGSEEVKIFGEFSREFSAFDPNSFMYHHIVTWTAQRSVNTLPPL